MAFLVTPVDRDLLNSRGISAKPLKYVDSFGNLVSDLRWDTQLLGDSELYGLVDRLQRVLATTFDDYMDYVRTYKGTLDPSRQQVLVDTCRAGIDDLIRVTDRLGTDLNARLRDRTASTLHGVCVEFSSRVKKVWIDIDVARKTALRDALLDYTKRLELKPAKVKEAKFAGAPRELSSGTFHSIEALAREDHKLRPLLEGTLYGSEMFAPQLVQLLRRFPSIFMRSVSEYVVFTVNSSTLVLLNDWLISSDLELLKQLANGEVPKVASTTTRIPTVTVAIRRADITPPIGYSVARATFTSNARNNPAFFDLMKEFRAVQVGRNTWDIPVEPGSETKGLRTRLSEVFGYPAQVVELLAGPGDCPPEYNYMSRTAMPLWVLKSGSANATLTRSSSGWEVREAAKVLGTFKKRTDAKRVVHHFKDCARRSRKLANAQALPTKSTVALERLAHHNHALIPVADSMRVVTRFLVADLRDFISVNGLLVYQPQVGEKVLHSKLGEVTVTAISPHAQMWLTIREESGQVRMISLPDLAGRQTDWLPGEDDPYDADMSYPVDMYVDGPDGAVPTQAPYLCDDADLTHLDFTSPVSPAINTFVPLENMGAQASNRERTVKAPLPRNNPDPMNRLVQESGGNPLFNQPRDPDIDHSSSSEADEFGGPPEATMRPGNQPSVMPFQNPPAGPTPTLANLGSVQKYLREYTEQAQVLRNDHTVVDRKVMLERLACLDNVIPLLHPDGSSSPLSTLKAVRFELKNGIGNMSGTLNKTIVGMLEDFDNALEYLQ